MSQKFISLDDASARLGVSKDRLNQLREAGDLRAYRDGASWKFRTEEIEKLEADGMPAANDLTLDDDYSMATGSDLGLASLDDGPPTPEPTKNEASAEDGGDDDIGLGIEPLGDGDDAESILLTGDQDLEGGIPRPQSTIIGKSELSLEDDLELASSSDVTPSDTPPMAPADGGSFDGVEELELDLEAESSLKLSGGSDAGASAPPKPPAPEESGELELEELELDLAGSDINAGGVSGSDILGGGGDLDTESPSLSGLGSVTGLSGIDSIDLAADEDDDMVLGGSDSDDSGDLAAGDSGINLSPSDSGFALDEVPLDLGGSAIGSQLDLASLSAAGSGASGPAISGLGGEDFQLTPADSGEEDEDSSQIVALDDISEEDEEDVAGFEPDEEVAFDGGLGTEAAVVPAGAVAVQEVPFPGWIIGLLGGCFFAMLLCGLMAMDLVQSMWSWSEPFAFNSAVIEGLLGIFGG